MEFFERLDSIVADKGTSLCVGLDPYFSPKERTEFGDETCLGKAREANLRIVERTSPFAAAFKPNIAFYEALGQGGLELLRQTIEAIPAGIPVILDAKRGDIGSTALAYAQAAFDVWNADAVTVSPYMGTDTFEAFLAYEGKGIFALCRTSNPGAAQFQDLVVGGKPLYLKIAEALSPMTRNVGLVVAGNDVEALGRVRRASPDAWFLAPGIGAQGGKADEALKAGARADGSGVLVVAARSVAGAEDPAAAARALRDEIRAASLSKTSQGWTGTDSVASSTPAAASVLKAQLVGHLVNTGCLRLGDFILKSGRRSPFYIDLRRLVSDPEAMACAAAAYASLAAGLGFDRLAGIPAAGLPLATAAAMRIKVPMIWPRMPVKDHGTGNRIEGDYARGERALLLDDLITTGASKLEALDLLRGEGLVVQDLIVLIERGRQGRKDMESAGVSLHAFLQVRELFEYCLAQGTIDAAAKEKLDAYLDAE